MLTNPLGLGNWQMTQKTVFALHNKTGSEVYIGASTMARLRLISGISAPFPSRPPHDASHASLTGAKFGRSRFRTLPARP